MNPTQTQTPTEDPLQTASRILLTPADIDAPILCAELARARGGVDWADIYAQRREVESWRLEEGEVKTGRYSLDCGVGLRALRGEAVAYAHSDEISRRAVSQFAAVARAAKLGQSKTAPVGLPSPPPAKSRYAARDPLADSSSAQKIAVLQKLDSFLRAADSRVENVIAGLVAARDIVLVARADGRVAADVRPLVRLSVEVVVRRKNRRERGHGGCGGRVGIEFFTDETVAETARRALHEAVTQLDARAAPAGAMPVVLGGGWAGILLHEAVGHGLEGDFNRKGQSAFSGRVGERVASPQVTVVDDGTLPDRRGSLSIDDEGQPSARNTLIENGILRGYLQDMQNARLMNAAPTGNGRRESYAYAPMPRMTNTFMPAGEYPPAEIVAAVKRGIYAVNFSGGEVDITSGNFVFVASEAYKIENGKIGAPIKGATIIGNGPAVMQKVSMVGDDCELDSGIGTCGKDGQWVPVGVGQPTVLLDEITVGGTETE